jgi:hypothetical protein
MVIIIALSGLMQHKSKDDGDGKYSSASSCEVCS